MTVILPLRESRKCGFRKWT